MDWFCHQSEIMQSGTDCKNIVHEIIFPYGIRLLAGLFFLCAFVKIRCDILW
jgi:hypothetical protein